jgi:hypothetical protein
MYKTFFFLNRKDVYCSNNTSPAKPEGLSAGAHAAVKQGCSTAWYKNHIYALYKIILNLQDWGDEYSVLT